MDARPFRSECRAIVFDFGGTLDSDGEHWLDRFYEGYRQAGLNVAASEIKRVFYLADACCCRDPAVRVMGLRSLMAHHVALQLKALGLADEKAASRLVESFCRKSEWYLRRNTRLLKEMHARFRLGVVSNFYGNVEVLCREAGLAPALDAILDSAQIGVYKPDIEMFRIALKMLKLHPGEAVFVGDSYERDMLPAHSLGMRTVWLKNSRARLPEEAATVDASIESLMELKLLIR